MGGLVKMKIMPFNYKGENDREEFPAKEVSINPESYTRNFTPSSCKPKKLAIGQLAEQKVVEFSESISFDIWFDSTGAIPDTEDVSESLKWLVNELVKFDGDAHATRCVQLSWASLMFEGQLKSLSVQYLYFEQSGYPLRAKASLSFEGLAPLLMKEKGRDKHSPDLTHMRTVKDGDNLPMMCYDIYQSPNYYLQVAKANGLSNFMNLKPGQVIVFPPLETSRG